MKRPIKLNIPTPKRPVRRHAPASQVAHELAANLSKLHREHGHMGPLLFGFKHHREIAARPDTPEALATLAFDSDGYGSDIRKGVKLAALVVRKCIMVIAFVAMTAIATTTVAEHRPPFDLDAYCLPDDVVCSEPWLELSPPDPLHPTCLLRDPDDGCTYSYTVRRAWICYDHRMDQYGPEGIIAAIHGVDDDICMVAGLGKGHRPFNEILPGWTHPRNYTSLVIREVLIPCVEAIRAYAGIDEPITEDKLRLNSYFDETIAHMVAALEPVPSSSHKELLDGFRAECMSVIEQD